jgi:Transposase DDE domain
MDRGYDSEDIHLLIRQDLNADSIIPPRFWKNEIVGGTYRKERVLMADDPKYRRRQLVETTFSVLKRKFGRDLNARKFTIQIKEIASKIIVYNIHKFLLCSLLRFSTEQNIWKFFSNDTGTNPAPDPEFPKAGKRPEYPSS